MRLLNDPTNVKSALEAINNEVGAEYEYKQFYKEQELSIYLIAKLQRYNIVVYLSWDTNGDEQYQLREVL